MKVAVVTNRVAPIQNPDQLVDVEHIGLCTTHIRLEVASSPFDVRWSAATVQLGLRRYTRTVVAALDRACRENAKQPTSSRSPMTPRLRGHGLRADVACGPLGRRR